MRSTANTRLGGVGAGTLVGVGLVVVIAGALAWTFLRPGPGAAPQGPGAGPAGKGPEPTFLPPPKPALTAEQVETLVSSAVQRAEQGEYGQAETILEGAIRENPKTQELYLALGQIKMGRDAEGAYAAFEKAAAVGPKLNAVNGGQVGPVQYAAGTAAMGAGKFDRAEEHFGAAIAAEPRTAEYHLGMAAVMDRLGKLDDAFMELTKASNLDPNNPATWAGLADNNMRRNRPQLGLQYISKARELEPRKAAWRLVEARALNRMNRAEEAVNVLAGLEGAERNQLAVLRLVSESYGLLGKPGEAAAWWVKGSDAVPTDPQLAYEGALASRKGGRLEDAKRLADRAAVLGHREATALKGELAAAGEK